MFEITMNKLALMNININIKSLSIYFLTSAIKPSR